MDKVNRGVEKKCKNYSKYYRFDYPQRNLWCGKKYFNKEGYS